MKRSELMTKLAQIGVFPEIDGPDTNESKLIAAIYGSQDDPAVPLEDAGALLTALPGFSIWDAQPSDPVIRIAAWALKGKTFKIIDAMMEDAAKEWKPWAGGPCPVGLDQWVECLFDGGPDEPECEHIARYLTWGPSGNIRAYRCIPTPA